MRILNTEKKSSRKLQAVKHKKKEKRVEFKSKYFIVGSVLTLVSISMLWLWTVKPVIFPVSSVQVVGDLRYVDQKVLKNKIVPVIASGFFSLDVSVVKQQLLEIPWIKEIRVSKVWPSKLIIRIEEHTPSVVWNQTNIISEPGVLLSPDLKNVNLKLPHLNGPKDKHLEVWQQYLEFKQILAPIDLRITSLELAARGAWRLTLDNGVQVILGTHEVKSRLHRFVVAFDKNLKREQQSIEYVDMRYTSGMAVGWKSA